MWFAVRLAGASGSFSFDLGFRPGVWGRRACALLLSVVCAVLGNSVAWGQVGASSAMATACSGARAI
jgi:hypothetical protein